MNNVMGKYLPEWLNKCLFLFLFVLLKKKKKSIPRMLGDFNWGNNLLITIYHLERKKKGHYILNTCFVFNQPCIYLWVGITVFSVMSSALWPPGSSVRGILQARVLEWVAIPFSRRSSQPRNQTWISHIAGRFFTLWATREAFLIYFCLVQIQ